MKLPEGIDPSTPVGELTDEQIATLAASFAAHKRWAGVSAAKRHKHGKMLAKARAENMTQEQRSAIARKAGQQRAINAGQKLRKD